MSTPRLAGFLAAAASIAVIVLAFLLLVDPRWV